MKNSKLYFILSMFINVLFLVSALVVFFNPFGIVSLRYGFDYGNLGWTVFLAPFVLLLLVILLALWGAWLASMGKIRNKLVIVGLVACLVSFSVTAVLVQNRLESTKCPFEEGELGWPCVIANPL